MVSGQSSDSSGSESESSSSSERESLGREEREVATINAILGDAPASSGEKGPPLCDALVSRWSSYLSAGLEKDTREALTAKYKLAENCPLLDAPKLNPEIEASLTTAQIKRDQFSMSIQNKLGRALSAQGSVLNVILSPDAAPQLTDDNIKTALADAAKLICEAHYLLSYHRKHELYPSLNAEVQKIAMKSKIDSLLFGEDFQEKYKVAKEVKKTSLDLKAGPSGYKKKDHLNYKRQNNRPRFKAEKYDDKRKKGKQLQWRRSAQSSQQQRGLRKYHI